MKQPGFGVGAHPMLPVTPPWVPVARGLGQEPPVLVPGQRLAVGRGSARCWPGAGAGSSDR